MPDPSHPNPCLADLREGESFEGFYVAREASLSTTTNGKGYIRILLADATSQLSATYWDASPEDFRLCPPGSVLKIQAQVEIYRGHQQLKIIRFRPAQAHETADLIFIPVSRENLASLRTEFLDQLASLADHDYLALAQAFFHAPDLLDAFCRWPAARTFHHAWLGGLLEHTVSVVRAANHYAAHARLNRDLLLIGSILHDIGKLEELCVTTSIEYSDRGKLLGHLFLGAEMLSKRAAGLGGFPDAKLHLVQHLILSHHGRLEYGSPVLPKIPEAFVLHHLDNLDAKVAGANRLLENLDDPEKRWTDFTRQFDSALFRADPPGGKA
ncbi:MAG: HD domain-containing protein [Planctomycetota bacterium]|nr:HD domain-containing protein [Planctomycetota bacterium]